MVRRILVTGGAGFIGSNLVLKLIKDIDEIQILSVDNLNDYYDVNIKKWRLIEIEKEFGKHPNSFYSFVTGDISNPALVNQLFMEFKPDIVVNLAAQAGVRYSITNPDAYIPMSWKG